MLRRESPRLAVAVGYVLAALAFTWPLPVHLGTALPGDPNGDTGIYIWNQWVFHRELLSGHNPLRTESILALTEPVDLSQHNYTVFLNLLALPLMDALGVVRTFNLVFLATTVLTALMTYLLVRHVTSATRAEAWLAGAAFAWSPILVARSTAHFSLVAAAPLPAFVLCLIRANRTRRMRDAALAGLCMAWAALCDPYYAVYCLMIACGYLLSRVVHVTCARTHPPARWRWPLDMLIVSVGGLVAGLVLSGGWRFTVLGLPISMHGLYTPVFLLTCLIVARVAVSCRPHVRIERSWSFTPVRIVLVGVLACAGPLSPVLYGLGERMASGRLSLPETYWRSSPRGVDLLAFFEFNPNHAWSRAVYDRQLNAPGVLTDYTAAIGYAVIAVVIVAMWRARLRPPASWAVLTLGFAALALGPFVYFAGVNTYIPGPWALLRYVPIIDAARAPGRFAVVASLGAVVLMAVALAALGRQYPQRRRLICCAVGLALAVELAPVPRTLFSAEIPAVYRIIAADPRPVRVLELPFGVRDGTFAVGNFSARYLYNQTLHGKQLLGGYLSRISQRRVDDVRSQPTLDALIRLSEGQTLSAAEYEIIRARGRRFVRRSNLAYVVVHEATPPALLQLAIDAWQLEEVARMDGKVLYRSTIDPLAGDPDA
jgi:hypothetical protein